jgi:hypothetical protein
LAVFAGVFAFALCFAAYTQHAWEDYYITYRVSKNLATGHGLVYTIGEKVHAFTSPLNVLLPAALSLITGNSSDDLVLWLFRVLGCSLLGAAAVLLFDAARKNSLSLGATGVLIGMFALDAKIVDFSINGQEIAFMMFFLALAFDALSARSRWTGVKLGLAWAGLMWTRPDGFVYFGAVALGFLLFDAGRSVGASRLGLLKIFLWAGAVTTVLYLPWVLWAWHYYGSPIPHTLTAKGYVLRYLPSAREGSFKPGFVLLSVLAFPFRMLLGRTAADLTFMPIYSIFGGWPHAALLWSKWLSCICALYWVLPFGRPQGRAFSFAFMLGLLYLTDASDLPRPWYLPNAEILGIFTCAQVVQQGLDFARALHDKWAPLSRPLTNLVRVVAASILSITLLLTAASAYQLRVQQREIEEGNRKQIGLWLRQHAASTADTVFLEPLGYIGFFSQLKMLDYPGISAPEVVAVIKKFHSGDDAKRAAELRPDLLLGDFPNIIGALRPDWLVLRPDEAAYVGRAPALTRWYDPVKTFDASERLKSYRWLPGRGYLAVDQTFIVFRRNQSKGAARSTVTVNKE